jgi:hypothetical protein
MHLCTTIERPDQWDDPVELGVVIEFRATSYTKADPGRYYGEPGDCWPAEDAQYEFAIDSIELDAPNNNPTPLTEAERSGAADWFFAHHAKAVEAAETERENDTP